MNAYIFNENSFMMCNRTSYTYMHACSCHNFIVNTYSYRRASKGLLVNGTYSA